MLEECSSCKAIISCTNKDDKGKPRCQDCTCQEDCSRGLCWICAGHLTPPAPKS
jgi:hypothetical protein